MTVAKKLLKVPEAAEMLTLSQKTIWQWIAMRRIGVVRLGRAVRIPLAEIDRLTSEGTTLARFDCCSQGSEGLTPAEVRISN
jgi:excisionase family DNA binding protein